MDNDNRLTPREKFFTLMTVVVFFFAILGLMLSIKTVDAGEVRVVTAFGGTTGRVLEPGFNMVKPFVEGTKTLSTKKVIYETSTVEGQKNSDADYKDHPVDTNTSDGQQVNVFYTIRFSVDPTKAVWVVNNIGGMENLVEKVVKTESRIWARNIPRRFEAEKLYQGDGTQEVQDEIFNRLQPIFEENGLILDSVGLREIKFTDQYVAAIEAKQIAKVQIETEQNKATQAIHRKQARITEAEGKAEEQRLQRETLSDQVLEKTQLDVQQTVADALKISAEKGVKIVPDTVLGEQQLLFGLGK